MNQSFEDDLFGRVLLEPARNGATELFVVSGYSSPAMVTRHFESLLEAKIHNVKLDLQIGMVSRDGIDLPSLIGFQKINGQLPGLSIKCRLNTGRPIHSKIYVWCDDNGPVQAFTGSANYTQTGFNIGAGLAGQVETCVEVDPLRAFDFVVDHSSDTISCTDPDVQNHVHINEVLNIEYLGNSESGNDELSGLTLEDSVILPLVQTRKNVGNVHNPGAGLNWGQRGNRNRDEAYIPIPASVRDAGVLPPKGVHFQLLTDDGDSFIATVAQDGSKAIETPQNNALLGKYFRRKLGVTPGSYITDEMLAIFGSNAVKIGRMDAETYFITFEPGLMFPLEGQTE